MKITHPVDGYTGYVRVGDHGLRFLAGNAYAKADDIPDPVRKALIEDGYEFIDERRKSAE